MAARPPRGDGANQKCGAYLWHVYYAVVKEGAAWGQDSRNSRRQKSGPTDSAPKGGKIKVLRDKSLQVGTSHEGEVDCVVMAENQESQRSGKVWTHQYRVLQVGDKFSSRG